MSSIPATPQAITPGVSLTMIVKNEESNIAACLESVRDLVDEIVVVDTGSSDATKSIAAGMGARVFDFPWVDDFAAAFNESIRYATREWIFRIDADDRLDEENHRKLRALFSQLPAATVAYWMKYVSSYYYGRTVVVDVLRLFRNNPRIIWRYRVHEQLMGAIESGNDVRWSDVAIHHTGYQNAQRLSAKLSRNLRLAKLDHAEHPNDPFTIYNLGFCLFSAGQMAEALPYLEKSIAIYSRELIGWSTESTAWCRDWMASVYAKVSDCHAQLGQSEQALRVCREGRQVFPNNPELLEQELRLLEYELRLTYAIPKIVCQAGT
jgi:glycosyltransferase involved in cell wall biosynthesis